MTSTNTPNQPKLKDAGMSLVELIVYSGLTALVIVVVAALFVSGVQTDTATKARDAATGDVLVISSSLQTAIRNSSDFAVTGNLLRARVAAGSSGWGCAAWAVTPDGALVYRTSTSAIAIPTDFSGWAVLAEHARGTLAGGQAFIKSGNRLEAQLEVTVGASVVQVSTDAVARAKGEGSPSSCW